MQIAIRIADNVRSQPATRIDPARFEPEVEPGQAEREHGLALARREIAAHPDETAMRGQVTGDRLDIEIGQDAGERFGGFGGIPDEAWIGKQGMGLQGRRQHLAGAVKQIAARRFGHHRTGRGGMGRTGNGQLDRAHAEHAEAEREAQPDNLQPAARGIERLDFRAFNPQQA